MRVALSAIGFVLLSVLSGCGGGSVDPGTTRTKGRIIAEEHIAGRTLPFTDSVLDNLEPAGATAGPSDTGGAGDDHWSIEVDAVQTISLGIDGVPNISLAIEDQAGNTVGSVISGQQSVHVLLQAGTYRVALHNLGTSKQNIWVGWRDGGRATEAGIYASELTNVPNISSEVATSQPLFMGIATPFSTPITITSFDDFKTHFQPLLGGRLNEAMRMYFLNGGGPATVIGLPDNTPESHLRALESVSDQLGLTNEIVVMPDAADLPVADWGSLATQMDQAIEGRAMLILDPPASARTYADVPSLRAVLPSSKNVCVYFPWLIGPGSIQSIPPSGMLAGVWAANDESKGVWIAPADVELLGVQRPEVVLTDSQSGDLNAPLDGKAFNALRLFTDRGTLVWGARTLDANSNDNRYIPTVRTLIYIEQSLKTVFEQFVFAENDAQTWAAVVAAFSDFLTTLWQEGGLMGDKASDAFTVQCGLGTTMTPQDILNGYMIAQVTVALIRPAEFVVLTFKQQMVAP